MTKPVKVRLATLLTNPADEYGQDTEDGCRSAALTVTHDDLARLWVPVERWQARSWGATAKRA